MSDERVGACVAKRDREDELLVVVSAAVPIGELPVVDDGLRVRVPLAIEALSDEAGFWMRFAIMSIVVVIFVSIVQSVAVTMDACAA